MPYYYGTATQQNTNASANTDTLLMNITGIAGFRGAIQKLICGTYVTPADNAVRLQLRRTTALNTAGSAIVPNPMAGDSPAASAVLTTLPTAGTLAAVPVIQLAFNQRGTAMWAAFNPDEGITVTGAAAANGQVVVDSQSTGTSVPVSLTLVHSE